MRTVMKASWAIKYLICIGFVLILGGCGGAVEGDGSGGTDSGGTGTGSALVSWTPPTENSDGSTLEDLAGYRIYYGNSPGDYDRTITVASAGLSSYQVDGLETSDLYFVMTAFNTLGVESSYSEEVYKRIE
jgi:hypothetical protein